MEKVIQWVLILMISPFVIQCTSTGYISSPVTIESQHVEYQYSDSTIAHAFAMMPQLNSPMKIAVFGASEENLHIAGQIESIEGVGAVTYITSGLIDLQRGLRHGVETWHRTYRAPRVIDLMQLRYLAAQSHSDLILFVEMNHTSRAGANGLAITYAGILPMFFVPGNNVEVVSTVEFYLIDVRNGFIYSSYQNRIRSKKNHVRISYGKHINRMIEAHKPELIESILDELQRVISHDDYFVSANSH